MLSKFGINLFMWIRFISKNIILNSEQLFIFNYLQSVNALNNRNY